MIERMCAVSACFGCAGLWWGGYSSTIWRQHGIHGRWAAVWSLAIGLSLWIPPYRDLAVGFVVVALALAGLFGQIVRRRWLATFTIAGAYWSVARWLPSVFQGPSAIEWFAVTLGLLGMAGADDPVEALGSSLLGILLGSIGYRLSGPHNQALNRTGVALMVLAALVGWSSSWLKGYWRARAAVLQKKRVKP